MDDSNSQTFASGYFFSLADYQNHSYFVSLRALISSPVSDSHKQTECTCYQLPFSLFLFFYKYSIYLLLTGDEKLDVLFSESSGEEHLYVK